MIESQQVEIDFLCQPSVGRRQPWTSVCTLPYTDGADALTSSLGGPACLPACLHVWDPLSHNMGKLHYGLTVLWSYGSFLSPSLSYLSSFFSSFHNIYTYYGSHMMSQTLVGAECALTRDKTARSCWHRTILVLWDRDVSIGACRWI